jgi:hypothetical protein
MSYIFIIYKFGIMVVDIFSPYLWSNLIVFDFKKT